MIVQVVFTVQVFTVQVVFTGTIAKSVSFDIEWKFLSEISHSCFTS